MGDGFIHIVYPEIRRLTLANKGMVNQYLLRVQSLFYHHQIDKKIDWLKDNWDQLDKELRKKELNKFDNEFTSVLLSSERNCRRLGTSAIEYSSTLSKAGLI